MADKGMTLAIVLLVAGLIVGGGIGYFAAPPKPGESTTTTIIQKEIPLKNAVIKLGYIAASTSNLETGKPYHEDMIMPKLDAYSALLGYGATFQYQIDDANQQPNTHLEKVQGFKSAGITVFEGGGWSAQAQGSLQYVNSNNMLMWSTSSTSPTLSLADDRLYRMCTNDIALSAALADVMWAAGVKTIVLFQRGDSWGDGIINLLVPIWEGKGGKLGGEKIRYAQESTEFANYVDSANQQVVAAVASYGGETQRVGVVILSFDEAPVIAKQAAQYPGIYNVHWWGSDGTAKSMRLMDDSPEEANHIGIYSLLSHETPTPLYSQLEAEYTALTGQQFSTYTAYGYDVGMVVAISMFQAQSQNADDILALQLPTCAQFFGAAGWSKLDPTGDRVAPPYDVWGFFPGTDKASVSKIMARYDPILQKTTFDTAILGFTPIGPS